MAVRRVVHSFKKGQRLMLDDIYVIQGLDGGDWWQKTGTDVRESDNKEFGEELVCTRTVTITIEARP